MCICSMRKKHFSVENLSNSWKHEPKKIYMLSLIHSLVYICKVLDVFDDFNFGIFDSCIEGHSTNQIAKSNSFRWSSW